MEGNIGDEPLDVVALGFAMEVGPKVVSVESEGAAARAGIKAGDVLHSVTLNLPDFGPGDDEDTPKSLKFVLDGKPAGQEIAGSYASVFDELQRLPLSPVKIQVAGSEAELILNPTPVTGWFHPQRGLQFVTLTRRLAPQSVPMALKLAWSDTVENASQVYYMIRGLVQRTLSKDSVGGPVKIAKMAYDTARIGQDAYVPFLGMLSINLAVVNFLPIPPLDGGQLLFLICEKVRGRPVPEKYAGPVMIAGLVFILLLFVFVNLNDLMSVFG